MGPMNTIHQLSNVMKPSASAPSQSFVPNSFKCWIHPLIDIHMIGVVGILCGLNICATFLIWKCLGGYQDLVPSSMNTTDVDGYRT